MHRGILLNSYPILSASVLLYSLLTTWWRARSVSITINYYKIRKCTEIFHLLHGIIEFQYSCHMKAFIQIRIK